MTIRQFSMMSLFEHQGYSVADALKFNQTTFGSLCFQKWVRFDATRQEFVMSTQGADIYRLNQHLNHFRKTVNEHSRFSVRVKLNKRLRTTRSAKPVQPVTTTNQVSSAAA